jgi:ion channel POLLUX/CASTOR
MIKLPLVDRIKFLVERQFVRGAGFQLLIVAIVIGLISLIGGVAVHWALPGQPARFGLVGLSAAD